MTLLTPPPSDTAAELFPSLAALKAAHIALLEQRLRDDGPDLLPVIAAFVRRGSATGALLDADGDRWACQSVLDYWANVLYRAGEDPPEATLAEFDPAAAPDLDPNACPYLGLDAFREGDRDLFYGRQRLLMELLARLATRRLLIVVGPSGSGKSSVVLAGLAPALKAGMLPGSEQWRILPPIVPGSDPLAALARLLPPPATNGTHWLDHHVAVLRQDSSTLLHLLNPETPDHSTTDNPQSPIQNPKSKTQNPKSNIQNPALLIIDQFEEVFTLCDDRVAREAFISNLLALVDAPGPRHTVVLTLRSDFESHIARSAELEARFDGAQVRVTPLNASELREAIEQPAARVGLRFEAGVVDALLQDILGEPAALPLLQFTLLKLWEHRERTWVTWRAYSLLGGGRLALARSADAWYASLIPEEQTTARRILLRMVRPGDGLEVTSNRVRQESLYRDGDARDRIERVLDKLCAVRLLRRTPGDTPADTQVEIAHEALVRNWPQLVDWLEEERAALMTRRRLEGLAAEWVRLGRGASGLLDEVQVGEAERWLQSAEAATLGYDDALPALVVRSRAALHAAAAEREAARNRAVAQELALREAERQREAEQQRAADQARTTRRTRLLAAVLLVLLLAAIGVGAFAYRQLVIADSQRLAFAAQSQAEAAPETALLLAVAAVSRDHNSASEQALRDALDQVNWQPHAFVGHTGGVASAVYSPDGTLVLTASADGTARLWNADGSLRVILSGHPNGLSGASFSPDGQHILTTSVDGTVRLWDLAGTALALLQGHSKALTASAWSPDGQRIATASEDKTARIWDRLGREVAVLAGHNDVVTSVAWSPDGQIVATGSRDHDIRLWRADGTAIATLTGHTAWVNSLAWSPDGQLLLSAAEDETARVWRRDGGELLRLVGHSDVVAQATWSADGKWIVTASWDQTARVWDLEGTERAVLRGHTDWVTSAVWSADGERILTASADFTTRLWNRSGRLLATLGGHTDRASAASFSPDGERILTASADGTARVWLYVGPPLPAFVGHSNWVNSAVYSPDGTLVVTASADGTARLWDARSGRQVALLAGHATWVNDALFSPDGQSILTASYDGTARLWDLKGNLLTAFVGHGGPVLRATFSRSGRQVLTTSRDDTARLWDLRGRQLALFQHKGDVYTAVWSPDDQRILTASEDKTAKLWDLAGNLLVTFSGHTDVVNSATFSPDGTQIVTAGWDNTAKLWDLTGRELATMRGHTNQVVRALWSPDGQTILTASKDQTARLWDLSGRQRAVLSHSGRVLRAIFSSDGTRILTASRDQTARLWDSSGRLLVVLHGHTSFVNTASFSPDGRLIVTASNDGTARQHFVADDKLLEVAACRVGRGLTPEERTRFGVTTPGLAHCP